MSTILIRRDRSIYSRAHYLRLLENYAIVET
jgi:hypothetical protein